MFFCDFCCDDGVLRVQVCFPVVGSFVRSIHRFVVVVVVVAVEGSVHINCALIKVGAAIRTVSQPINSTTVHFWSEAPPFCRLSSVSPASPSPPFLLRLRRLRFVVADVLDDVCTDVDVVPRCKLNHMQ